MRRTTVLIITKPVALDCVVYPLTQRLKARSQGVLSRRARTLSIVVKVQNS
jgi:hypothetical protein